MKPACCSVPATRVTEGRRTPSIWARNSWVRGNSSEPTRSWVSSIQREQRSSIECKPLQATCWLIWVTKAWVYRWTSQVSSPPSETLEAKMSEFITRASPGTWHCTNSRGLRVSMPHDRDNPIRPSLPTVAISTPSVSSTWLSSDATAVSGKYTV